jgi:hypothetical protein
MMMDFESRPRSLGEKTKDAEDKRRTERALGAAVPRFDDALTSQTLDYGLWVTAGAGAGAGLAGGSVMQSMI